MNGSFLILSLLTDGAQLTLHLVQLLLQLLQTNNAPLPSNMGSLHLVKMQMRQCEEPHHVVSLALVDLGLQGLDLELGLLQLADTLTSRTLILVQLALLLLDQVLR